MMFKCVVTVLGGLAVTAVCAQGATIATFADPSTGPTPSLFQYNSTTDTLTGGYSGTGLDLLTPGIAAPDFLDATFTFQTMVGVEDMFGMVTFNNPGAIQFFNAADEPILLIEFDQAIMTSFGFGGSDFVGFNVTMTGSILEAPIVLQDEAFAFSFANPTMTPTGFSVTAAFTSSATVIIPSAASTSIAGLACSVLAFRRRR